MLDAAGIPFAEDPKRERDGGGAASAGSESAAGGGGGAAKVMEMGNVIGGGKAGASKKHEVHMKGGDYPGRGDVDEIMLLEALQARDDSYELDGEDIVRVKDAFGRQVGYGHGSGLGLGLVERTWCALRMPP